MLSTIFCSGCILKKILFVLSLFIICNVNVTEVRIYKKWLNKKCLIAYISIKNFVFIVKPCCMKKWILLSTLFFLNTVLNAQQPKIISDATITFSVSNLNASQQNNVGSKIIYLKGKDIRIDLTSNLFSQTIFFNSNTGNATILKNIGQSKYISNYTADEWKKENSMYNGLTISFTNDTKKILDYDCKQAVLKLKNGSTYTVYYTPLLLPSVMENPFEFKDVPGLILEYESSVNENEKVIYTANKINFDPVPSFQFEIPKTGYRILH